MLSKMGYKPGMSLGKQSQNGNNGPGGNEERGLKEPISVELKTNRAGLGHDAEQKRKAVERVEAHYAHMAKRAKMNVSLSFIHFSCYCVFLGFSKRLFFRNTVNQGLKEAIGIFLKVPAPVFFRQFWLGIFELERRRPQWSRISCRTWSEVEKSANIWMTL